MLIPVSIFIPGENSIIDIKFDQDGGGERFIEDMMEMRGSSAYSDFYYNLVELAIKQEAV